ncbi:MAG TPA: hypothetical protein VFN88_10615 [Caulobacteraceae bacterium]|nr:hypothetical protein [Caulobacteraceae bacterium]
MTVCREPDGWRVSDEHVSEIYPHRHQAIARAQDLAEANAVNGAPTQLFIESQS